MTRHDELEVWEVVQGAWYRQAALRASVLVWRRPLRPDRVEKDPDGLSTLILVVRHLDHKALYEE
jgi:hypothetical protein